MPSEKGPDVTCSQSARAARGQGPPPPPPTNLQGAFLAPAPGPSTRGPPASSRSPPRRVRLNGSWLEGLHPPWPGRSWRRLPSPAAFVCAGPAGPETLSVPGGEGAARARPASTLPAGLTPTLSSTPGGGNLGFHFTREQIGSSEARRFVSGHTSHELWGGCPQCSAVPQAPPITPAPDASGESHPQTVLIGVHPDNMCSPPAPSQGCRGSAPRRLEARTLGVQSGNKHRQERPGWSLDLEEVRELEVGEPGEDMHPHTY
ncbi:synapsin-1-like [Prionailurus bengalensis]|uniref:synapsin-1-like n=1 Tax=Prionailurus bengalensis TaxID=37029 RepID=UPI001CA99D21|nr:synapsin-1-like [Prionailurus bengalensis]